MLRRRLAARRERRALQHSRLRCGAVAALRFRLFYSSSHAKVKVLVEQVRSGGGLERTVLVEVALADSALEKEWQADKDAPADRARDKERQTDREASVLAAESDEMPID